MTEIEPIEIDLKESTNPAFDSISQHKDAMDIDVPEPSKAISRPESASASVNEINKQKSTNPQEDKDNKQNSSSKSQPAQSQPRPVGRPRGKGKQKQVPNENKNKPEEPPTKKDSTNNVLKPPSKLPVARIKRIVKQDYDIVAISTPAVYAVAAATELFIQFFTEQALLRARSDKRKRLNYRDFSSSVESIEQLQFLKELIPQPRKFSELVSRGLVSQPELGKGQTTLEGFGVGSSGSTSSNGTNQNGEHINSLDLQVNGGNRNIGLDEDEEDEIFLAGGKKLAQKQENDAISDEEMEDDDDQDNDQGHGDEDSENEDLDDEKNQNDDNRHGNTHNSNSDSESDTENKMSGQNSNNSDDGDSDMEVSESFSTRKSDEHTDGDKSATAENNSVKQSHDYSPFHSDADRTAIAAKNSASVGTGAPPTKARRPKKHRHLMPGGGGIIFINETEKVARTIKSRETKKQIQKQQEGSYGDDDVEMRDYSYGNSDGKGTSEDGSDDKSSR